MADTRSRVRAYGGSHRRAPKEMSEKETELLIEKAKKASKKSEGVKSE
jgi:hypothetical protein